MSGRKHSRASLPDEAIVTIGKSVAYTAMGAGLITIYAAKGAVSVAKAVKSKIEKTLGVISSFE